MLESSSKCPICNSETNVEEISERDLYNVTCPRCGSFTILDDALTMFQRSKLADKVLSLSFWIRKNQITDSKTFINIVTIRNLLIPFVAPKVNEQADNLILWMGNTLVKPNQQTSIETNLLIPIVGAYDASGVDYIARYLLSEGIISEEAMSKGLVPKIIKAKLTFNGWAKFDELKRTSKDSRLAFMAMKFENEVLDNIFNTVIKDAVSHTGFEIRKLDEEKRAGLIDDKLRVEISRSKFLIADLTNDNNGAYWEAGYAEGLGMPVIYICEEEKFKEKKSHFDTNHHLTVHWKDDPEALKKFAEELKATIRATFPSEAKMED